MTGYDIFRRAEALLGVFHDGIHGESISLSDEYLAYLNQILSDIGCKEAASSSEPLTISEKQCEAVVFGVAMLSAVADSDRMKAEEFTKRYQRKRAAALSEFTQVVDGLPSPKGE